MNIRYERIPEDAQGNKYRCLADYTYYSKRFNRSIKVAAGELSDGATGAWDIYSDAWWVHDKICKTGQWEDGTSLDNFTASTVLGDILWKEGRPFRAVYWWWMTYLFGGGRARENGMRRLKYD